MSRSSDSGVYIRLTGFLMSVTAEDHHFPVLITGTHMNEFVRACLKGCRISIAFCIFTFVWSGAALVSMISCVEPGQ